MNEENEIPPMEDVDIAPEDTLDSALDALFAQEEAAELAAGLDDAEPLEEPDADAEPEEEEIPAAEEDVEPAPDETPEADPATPEADAAPLDDFDKQTRDLITEMYDDPHPGLKFAELRRELQAAKKASIASEDAIRESEEFQSIKLENERLLKAAEEAETLRNELNLLDYKTTPEYDRHVNKPLADIDTLAASVEAENGIDPGVLVDIVRNGNKKAQDALIDDLVANYNLSMRDQNNIFTMANQYLQVQATDATLKEQASTRLQELNDLEVSKTTEQQRQAAAAQQRDVDALFAKYEGRIPGFVTPDGLATEDYQAMRQEAKDVQLDNSSDRSYAILAASLLPKVLTQYEDQAKVLAEKNRLLAKYAKASPAAPSSRAPVSAPKKAGGESFLDRLDSLEFE